MMSKKKNRRKIGLFEILQAFTVFDYFTTIVETGKDLNHAATDGRDTYTIWLSRRDLGQAKRILRRNNIKVISETTTAVDREAGITIPRVGGWDSVKDAMELLGQNNIGTRL